MTDSISLKPSVSQRLKRSAGRGRGRLPDPPESRRIRIQISLLPSTLDYLRRRAVVSSMKNPSPSKVIADIIIQFQKEHPESLTYTRPRDPKESPIDW